MCHEFGCNIPSKAFTDIFIWLCIYKNPIVSMLYMYLMMVYLPEKNPHNSWPLNAIPWTTFFIKIKCHYDMVRYDMVLDTAWQLAKEEYMRHLIFYPCRPVMECQLCVLWGKNSHVMIWLHLLYINFFLPDIPADTSWCKKLPIKIGRMMEMAHQVVASWATVLLVWFSKLNIVYIIQNKQINGKYVCGQQIKIL